MPCGRLRVPRRAELAGSVASRENGALKSASSKRNPRVGQVERGGHKIAPSAEAGGAWGNFDDRDVRSVGHARTATGADDADAVADGELLAWVDLLDDGD